MVNPQEEFENRIKEYLGNTTYEMIRMTLGIELAQREIKELNEKLAAVQKPE